MKNILIIKHGSLGDIILALQAFNSIRNYFINHKVFVLTEKKYFSFFDKCPYIDSCIEDNRRDNFVKTFNTLYKLSKRKFDIIIDLQNSRRTGIYNIFFRIFCSTKISSSRPFAHYRYHIPKQGVETISSGLFNQLNKIGVYQVNNLNNTWLFTDLKENYKKPMALFIPGVSKNGDYKQWQPSKFAEVAKYLENLNYAICVVGTKNDLQSALPIIKSCRKVINKIDLSPPNIIYSLALNSKIIFSNDTGPGHIASLAKNNFVWIVNKNKISDANEPLGDHIYKIESSSIKNISSKHVIDFIVNNKLC